MTEGRRNTALTQRRLLLGLTQQQVADLVTDVVRTTGSRWRSAVLTGDYVSRLEIGRITWPNSVYRAAFRQVLGAATDAELGFYCQQVAESTEEEAVRRRDFLASLPAVALTGTSLGEVVAAAMAEPVTPPRRVGLEHVEQVRDLVKQAHVLDHRYGGGLAQQILGGQVRWAVGLLDSHIDRAARADLYSAVGDLCGRTAFTAHDAGAVKASQQYYVAALRCSEEADDWDLRAFVLGVMAHIAAHHGQGDEALTLVQQAQLRPDRLGPLRRLRLTIKEAEVYGALGNVQPCLTAISRAEDAFATDEVTDELEARRQGGLRDHQYGRHDVLGEGAYALHHLALRGDRVDETVTRLRAAVDAYPETAPRSRALDAARLATLLMRHGDPDEATQLGNQVLTAATTVRSARLTDGIRQLHHATTHHRGNPTVDDLRHRTSRTLAS